MGWQTRDWFLGPHREQLFDTFGNIGPSVWWGGEIVGRAWAVRPGGEIATRLLADVGREAQAAIEAAASALQPRLEGELSSPPSGLPSSASSAHNRRSTLSLEARHPGRSSSCCVLFVAHAVAESDGVKRLVTAMPVSSGIVARFVAGETIDDAVPPPRRWSTTAGSSPSTTSARTSSTAAAQATVDAYLTLLQAAVRPGPHASAEVSVKLSAVGQALPATARVALENARSICSGGRNCRHHGDAGHGGPHHHGLDLGILRELRAGLPETGAVLQAYLRRTEQDCRDLAYAGSRVRLCKGAYKEPESVAFQDKHDVDMSYVRCIKALMTGPGYPMIASHDPAWSRSPARWQTAPRRGIVRVPDALRHPAGRAAPPGRAARRSASTSPTATSGTATS